MKLINTSVLTQALENCDPKTLNDLTDQINDAREILHLLWKLREQENCLNIARQEGRSWQYDPIYQDMKDVTKRVRAKIKAIDPLAE